MKYPAALIVLAAAAIYGCSSSSSPSTPASVFYPLEPGHIWVYSVSEFDSAGTLLDTYPDTVRVLDHVVLNGTSWLPIVHSQYKYDTEYYSLRADGLWQRSLYMSYPALLYKYPTSPGDTFSLAIDTSYLSSDSTIDRDFNQTVRTAEHVTVPAGIFVSIHYELIFDHLDATHLQILRSDTVADYFVSPSVGLARSIERYSTIVFNSLVRRSRLRELVSHKP